MAQIPLGAVDHASQARILAHRPATADPQAEHTVSSLRSTALSRNRLKREQAKREQANHIEGKPHCVGAPTAVGGPKRTQCGRAFERTLSRPPSGADAGAPQAKLGECVCVCVCPYVSINTHTHAHAHTQTQTHTHTHTHTLTHTYTPARLRPNGIGAWLAGSSSGHWM